MKIIGYNLWLGILIAFLLSCSSSTQKSVQSNIDQEVGASVEESLDDFGDQEFAQDDFSPSEGDEAFDESFSEAEAATNEGANSTNEEVAQSQNMGAEDPFAQDFVFEEESSEEQTAADDSVDGSEESADLVFAETTPEEEQSLADNTNPPAADSTPEVLSTTDATAKVVGLDFLANQSGGTIMISTSQPSQFTQRKNLATGQYVIELSGVELPKKFQRPYDTREFDGAIGLFQAYQEEGSKVARFVIQLNGDAEPLVTQEGNSLMIVTSTKEPTLVSKTEVGEIFDPAVDQEAIDKDKAILNQRSLEDFISGNNKYYGKRINIELMDTDILRVFDIIAEQSGLNIIVSEDVRGKITLKLREIPWDQALMVVMQTKQLGYVKNGNILRIAPLKKIEDESNEARRVIEAQRRLQPLRVRMFPISFAKADSILGQVQEFLTPDRGKAKADTRTNQIVVRDIPEVLDKVSKLISQLDTETPQVLMEAKFVEATETFSKSINLNFGSAAATATTKLASAHAIKGVGSASDAGVDFNLLNVGKWGSITGFLNLYENKNMAKIISAPRVIGLNNETAEITQVTQILDRTISTDAETNTTSTSFVPKDVTLALKITPQITAEGSVLMDIDVQRDVPGAQETDAKKEVTARPIGKRTAKTKVLVPNGDTVVIGGVYQYDRTNVEIKMPYLGDIPILGWLFKRTGTDYQKNELMIFVTPRVLNIEKAFGKGERFLDEGDILGEGPEEKPSSENL